MISSQVSDGNTARETAKIKQNNPIVKLSNLPRHPGFISAKPNFARPITAMNRKIVPPTKKTVFKGSELVILLIN